jgi:hypothetical protein
VAQIGKTVETKMNRTERRQLRPECRFDKLESRELMSAGLSRPHIAHVAQIGPRRPRVITGTLNGVSSYTGDLTGSDTYGLAGRTSAGQVGIAGTDTFSSTLMNPSTYRDLYYAGAWTMTMSNGSTVQIAYSGAGNSSSTSGQFFENLKGTAIGVSGALMGKRFSFIGTASGPGTTPATTLKFRLSP